MSVTYLGSKSLGAVNLAIPLTLPAIASMLADLSARILSLNSQLTAYFNLTVTPPDPAQLAASLSAAAASVAGLIPTIIASIPVPIAAGSASLGAEIVALNALAASLQTVADTLTAAASAGGVHLLSVDSTPASVGSELAAVASGGLGGGLPSARIQGVIAVTESPATSVVMSTVFSGVPTS